MLKVSDFHSAAVQGKFLAKRGLWVSEYRVESGLNCGGHAFATKGLLLGPILAEFQQKRGELVEQLHATYAKALLARDRVVGTTPLAVRITAQGGIGTADEDLLLREYYGVDGTGWGTPFLLVPEVTNLDDEHLRKLCAASNGDVYLSDSSPFGLPFWNLRTSASEEARRRRIAENQPGSPCSKGFAKLFNTEFTKTPICTASREYQKLKLEQLEGMDLPEEQRAALREGVLAKSCICHDLAGTATRKNGIDPAATPAVCCGPNIVNFSRIATLEEMVGHIYGRISLLKRLRPSAHVPAGTCPLRRLSAQRTGQTEDRQSHPIRPATSVNSRRICSAASITTADLPTASRERAKTASSINLTSCSARCRVCSRPEPASRSVPRVSHCMRD